LACRKFSIALEGDEDVENVPLDRANANKARYFQTSDRFDFNPIYRPGVVCFPSGTHECGISVERHRAKRFNPLASRKGTYEVNF
jgi:hypothetical protein